MATRQSFPRTTFTDIYGNPIANGIAEIQATVDAQSPSGQLCSTLVLRVPLNSSGAMVTVPQLWGASALNPANGTYRLRVYSADGELVVNTVVSLA